MTPLARFAICVALAGGSALVIGLFPDRSTGASPVPAPHSPEQKTANPNRTEPVRETSSPVEAGTVPTQSHELPGHAERKVG